MAGSERHHQPGFAGWRRGDARHSSRSLSTGVSTRGARLTCEADCPDWNGVGQACFCSVASVDLSVQIRIGIGVGIVHIRTHNTWNIHTRTLMVGFISLSQDSIACVRRISGRTEANVVGAIDPHGHTCFAPMLSRSRCNSSVAAMALVGK